MTAAIQTTRAKMPSKLKLLPYESYLKPVHTEDPIRYYYWPVLGPIYKKRVEWCLEECSGGERILDVGFGSGVTFLNLNEGYDEIHGIDLTAAVDEVGRIFQERGIQTHLRQGNILDMPYGDDYFDTVMLISILEHIKPHEQDRAMQEIRRVLKPGGQLVYGVPVERPLMIHAFHLLGHDIRAHHFSTEIEVREAAGRHFRQVRLRPMTTWVPFVNAVYEVGHFVKG